MELAFRTEQGVTALFCATAPDSGLRMDLAEGEHYTDCCFEKFPLAAGNYFIEVALAQPGLSYLFRDTDGARLTVHPRDVFGSGMAPHASRTLFAAEHSWRPSRPRL